MDTETNRILDDVADGRAVIDALMAPEGAEYVRDILVHGSTVGCLDFVNDTSRIFGVGGDLIGVDDWGWRVATPRHVREFLDAVRAQAR